MGTIRAEGGIVAYGYSQIINQGLFEIDGNIGFQTTGSVNGFFNNNGLVKKISGDGNSIWGTNWDFNNLEGGIIDASAGTLRFYKLYNAEGGIIQGTATVYVPSGFINDGIVSPGTSPGPLGYSINYMPSSTGVLDIEIGGLNAGDEHDQLNVNRNAALNGTLQVSLLDGFIPEIGDSLIILTATGNITDSFNIVNTTPGLFVKVYVNPGDVAVVIDSIGTISVDGLTYDANPGFKLKNYPNPFSQSTKIEFELHRRATVNLEVFNALGKRVGILASTNLGPGSYNYLWNAIKLPGGYYFCKLTVDNHCKTQKMVLIK